VSEVREQFADLTFPTSGIHIASEFANPPANTTRQALNVRACDNLQRIRGGSRNGLEKYIPAIIPSGPNLIQDLNIVVYADAAALLTAIDAFADFPDPSTNNNAAGYGDRNPDPDGQGPRYVRTGGSGVSQNRHVRTPFKPLLIIRPLNQIKVHGTTFTWLGTEFTSSGLHPGDGVTFVQMDSTGAPSGAANGNYPITSANATGTGLSKYFIEYQQGTLQVQPGGSYGTFVGDWSGRFFLGASPVSGFVQAMGVSAGDTLMVCVNCGGAILTYPTGVSDSLGNNYGMLGSTTGPGTRTHSMWGVYSAASGDPLVQIDMPAGSGQVDVNVEQWTGGDGVTFPPNMDTPCL
jgi:hypothetical protein